MSPRNDLAGEHPRLYRAAATAAAEADAAAVEAGLAPGFVELVKVRVSQLNGCAYCLRAHSADALAKGEDPARLAVLPAWRETRYFDDVERASLAIAEATTLVASRRQGEEPALGPLSPRQASAVTWLAIVMNQLNRIAVMSGYDVAPRRRAS